MNIVSLIGLAKAKGASDLHLTAFSPPMMRIRGALQNDDSPSLTTEDMNQIFADVTTPRERDIFERELELDFAYAVPGVTRLRCNAAIQRGSISLAMRLIPHSIPTIDELHLPKICKSLVTRPRGLVMVSGPTGSGKSTTLAAMVDYLNHLDSRRVVTIEDPMEYVFTNDKCSIMQRELGSDTHSFVQALRHVLRQDPDVIMIGEMRDRETAAAALILAETGHLVLTTGHAPSASQAVERVVDLFPMDERHFAQTRMASLLIGIMCQALIPTVDESGRVPAVELMLGNSAVRSLIREGKIYQLPNVIRTSTQEGMQIMDQSLVDLYNTKQISGKNLLAYCNDRSEVEKLVGDVRLNLDAKTETTRTSPRTLCSIDNDGRPSGLTVSPAR